MESGSALAAAAAKAAVERGLAPVAARVGALEEATGTGQTHARGGGAVPSAGAGRLAAQLAALQQALQGKADRAAVGRQLASLRAALAARVTAEEMDAGLAGKLDVAAYLGAAAASSHAAAAVGALTALLEAPAGEARAQAAVCRR